MRIETTRVFWFQCVLISHKDRNCDCSFVAAIWKFHPYSSGRAELPQVLSNTCRKQISAEPITLSSQARKFPVVGAATVEGAVETKAVPPIRAATPAVAPTWHLERFLSTYRLIH